MMCLHVLLNHSVTCKYIITRKHKNEQITPGAELSDIHILKLAKIPLNLYCYASLKVYQHHTFNTTVVWYVSSSALRMCWKFFLWLKRKMPTHNYFVVLAPDEVILLKLKFQTINPIHSLVKIAKFADEEKSL